MEILQLIAYTCALTTYIMIGMHLYKLAQRKQAESTVKDYFKTIEERKTLSELQELDDKYEDLEQYPELYERVNGHS